MRLSMFENMILRSADLGGGGGAAGGGVPDPAAGQGSADTGGAAGPWYGAIEDADLKAFLTGKNAPDMLTGLKSWMHADKVARDRNVLSAPGDDPLQWDGWQKLGWEPDASKYKLEAPKVDGMDLDPGLFDAYSKAAHELRIPGKQAEALFGKAFGYMAEQVKALETSGAGALQRTEETLRKDWGADYDRNRELAARAMRTVGLGMDDAGQLDQLLGAPAMVQLFHKIGGLFGEDRLVTADGAGSALPRTVDGLEAELARLHADQNWMKAFSDPRHPNHANANAQRQRLLQAKARAMGLK